MASDALRYQLVETKMGNAAVVGGPDGLRGVILPGLSRRELRKETLRRFPGAEEEGRGLKRAVRALATYFETGRLRAGGIRLDLTGVGEFGRMVYEKLLEIPPGETVTYAELARRIGRPGANRAVGSAVSRNPLPVFIPCHRVLRSDGGLGGFTAEGGIPLKQAMLELEGAL